MTLNEKVQENTVIISSEDIREAISKTYPKFQVMVLDRKFWTVTLDVMKEIIDFNQGDKRKYLAERYDCDNFALQFKAAVSRNFGITGVGMTVDIPGKHSYNMLATTNEDSSIRNIFV